MRALHLRKKRASVEDQVKSENEEKQSQKRPDSATSKTSEQQAEEMLKSKAERRKLQTRLFAERSMARRNKWIDFQAQSMHGNINHEKKIRHNYFRDVAQTNPALFDFRPNSKLVKDNHLRQSVNQADAQYTLEPSKPLLGQWKQRQQTIQRDRIANKEKGNPIRMAEKSEHERMSKSIQNGVGGAMSNFDAEAVAFPKWRKTDKRQWMNNSLRSQFYMKEYTQPQWSHRGHGLTDRAKEPHILDDKSQLPPSKGQEEVKSAISPQKRASRLHATQNMCTNHPNYPKNFKSFQDKLNPVVEKFSTATRSNIVFGNSLYESTSLRQRTHLLDQKDVKQVGHRHGGSDGGSPNNSRGRINDSMGMTAQQFSALQNQGKDEDTLGKVAAFLGSGLDSVTEDVPEKRAHTTNATRRPKINPGQRSPNISNPKLNDSIGSAHSSQYMSDSDQIRNSNAVSIYLNDNKRPSTQGNVGAQRPSTQGNVGVSKIKLNSSKNAVMKNERPKPVKQPQRDLTKNRIKVCDITTENAFELIDEFYDLTGKSFIENRLLLVEDGFQNSTDIGSHQSPRTANVSKFCKSPQRNKQNKDAEDYLGFSQGHRTSAGLSQLHAGVIQSKVDRKKAYYQSLYENGNGATGTKDDRKEHSHIVTKFPYKSIGQRSKLKNDFESSTNGSKTSRNMTAGPMIFQSTLGCTRQRSQNIQDNFDPSASIREQYNDLIQSQLGETTAKAGQSWQEAQILEKKQIKDVVTAIFERNGRNTATNFRTQQIGSRANSRTGTQQSERSFPPSSSNRLNPCFINLK